MSNPGDPSSTGQQGDPPTLVTLATLGSDGEASGSPVAEPGKAVAAGSAAVASDVTEGVDERPAAPREISQLSILVVDDEISITEYLADFLSQDGHKVVAVNDSARALEVLRAGEFHVCILDLMMPKLSGMDLLEQLRRIDDDIAVIILTGYPSLETATDAIAHEVSAYIRKPFEADEFRAVITRIAKKKGLVLRREDELHQTIGRIIREHRKLRGLTLKQMSRRTALSVSLLSQIERAESSASVSSLFKVATALDVRITELFGEF